MLQRCVARGGLSVGRGNVLDFVDVAEPVVVETVPEAFADAFSCVVLHVPGAHAFGFDRVFVNTPRVEADVCVYLEITKVVGLADWAVCFLFRWVRVVQALVDEPEICQHREEGVCPPLFFLWDLEVSDDLGDQGVAA